MTRSGGATLRATEESAILDKEGFDPCSLAANPTSPPFGQARPRKLRARCFHSSGDRSAIGRDVARWEFDAVFDSARIDDPGSVCLGTHGAPQPIGDIVRKSLPRRALDHEPQHNGFDRRVLKALAHRCVAGREGTQRRYGAVAKLPKQSSIVRPV